MEAKDLELFKTFWGMIKESKTNETAGNATKPGNGVPWRDRWNSQYGATNGELDAELKSMAAERLRLRQPVQTQATPAAVEVELRHTREELAEIRERLGTHEETTSSCIHKMSRIQLGTIATIRDPTAKKALTDELGVLADEIATTDKNRIEQAQKSLEMLQRHADENTALKLELEKMRSVSATSPPTAEQQNGNNGQNSSHHTPSKNNRNTKEMGSATKKQKLHVNGESHTTTTTLQGVSPMDTEPY